MLLIHRILHVEHHQFPLEEKALVIRTVEGVPVWKDVLLDGGIIDGWPLRYDKLKRLLK